MFTDTLRKDSPLIPNELPKSLWLVKPTANDHQKILSNQLAFSTHLLRIISDDMITYNPNMTPRPSSLFVVSTYNSTYTLSLTLPCFYRRDNLSASTAFHSTPEPTIYFHKIKHVITPSIQTITRLQIIESTSKLIY